MRSATFGPTPGERATIALSRIAIALARSAGRKVERIDSATLVPTPCTVCSRRNHSRSMSCLEAEQADLVLAHMRLDRERHRIALRRQRLQGARRAVHHVADAVHVDDDVVLAVSVDDALELADHRIATFSNSARAMMRVRHRDGERVGGVLGLADRPSAAARRSSSGSAPSRRGPRRRSFSSPGSARIRRPTTPAFAGTSSAMPRACPSFRVATASRLTKVASTAASSGRNSSTMRASPSWIVTSRSASESLSLVSTEPHAR